jgi:cobalamin-dependent methionine synthase I
LDIEEARLAASKPIENRDQLDDRYECSRRPVWKRKNVLPQVVKSARVMKSSGLFIAIYQASKEAGDTKREWKNPYGDREGRCP